MEQRLKLGTHPGMGIQRDNSERCTEMARQIVWSGSSLWRRRVGANMNAEPCEEHWHWEDRQGGASWITVSPGPVAYPCQTPSCSPTVSWCCLAKTLWLNLVHEKLERGFHLVGVIWDEPQIFIRKVIPLLESLCPQRVPLQVDTSLGPPYVLSSTSGHLWEGNDMVPVIAKGNMSKQAASGKLTHQCSHRARRKFCTNHPISFKILWMSECSLQPFFPPLFPSEFCMYWPLPVFVWQLFWMILHFPRYFGIKYTCDESENGTDISNNWLFSYFLRRVQKGGRNSQWCAVWGWKKPECFRGRQ